MSREIKFRAWVGKMEYDITVGKFGTFFVNKDKNGDGLDERDSATLTPFNTKLDGAVLMQYTGLKDKNGKEIYEGDIFQAITDDSTHSENDTVNDVIFSTDGGWQIRAKNYFDYRFNHGLPIEWGGWREVVIIGNIYENPELLKQ